MDEGEGTMILYDVEWVKFGKFKLEKLKFEVSPKERLLIFGKNATGKTTILYSLLGLLRYKGKILINGYKPGSSGARKLISFLPERPMLYEKLSGYYNITYFLMINKINLNSVRDDISKIAERLGLSGLLDKKVETYSLGTKRKINLVEAYLLRRPIVLIDDIEANYDDLAVNFIYEWIKEQENTIFVATTASSDVKKQLEKKIGKKLKVIELE